MGAPYTLVGSDGIAYASDQPGTLGGHRGTKVYGRMDCRSAQRALARGGYEERRVFFADETAARTARYRPCGDCLREEYAVWKASQR